MERHGSLMGSVSVSHVQKVKKTPERKTTVAKKYEPINDWEEEITVDDVREAMALALPHRMRKKPFEDPRVDQQKINDMMQDEQKKTIASPT